MPVVLGHPDSAGAVALRGVARRLSQRARGLAGRSLGLTPAGAMTSPARPVILAEGAVLRPTPGPGAHATGPAGAEGA